MLFLQLLLFVVLLPGGGSEDDFQLPISIRMILTSSFYNRSRTQNQGSAWLDELQTHGWDSKTGAFTYLQPWSKGNFSNKELKEQERSLHIFSTGFPPIFHNHVRQWQLEYSFQIQVVKGCELRFGKTLECYLRIAYQGSDLVNFQNMTWQPSPKGGSRAQQICKLFNQYYVVINDILPRFFLGLLDAGKAYLLRQVRPEVWLSAHPSPGPGRLLLVCHVSGFYPKPVWVMWMRGQQEQRGTQRGDVLPHADGTWYLRVTLDVVAREAADLSCRVRHSSLGGQDMVLYWEQPHSMGLVFLAVIVPLVLLAGLALWLWRCWKTRWSPQCSVTPWSEIPASQAPVLT
ncbi:T-cell surface glycoprotein CD1a-like isoform X2 [Ailuropoda melanoleuca]|uniref:T-cell surface glycoprotein CD1a-like isoform X2 n=1 Tax=Ailuropoda melanoleuca TaxID=9646 RepID=UPI001494039B|nr:T-cell surface glycoprotein CD1a-like isoform X2 [Ailuropoda melanoleuca]